jgi:hypothetical protein
MRPVGVMGSMVVLTVFGLLLTACGETAPASTPTPLPPMTLAPSSDAIFIEGCATADLENWVERVDFLLRDFVTKLNLAQGQSPNLVRTTLLDMVPIRDALVAIPAPDGCAGDAHRLMLQMVDAAIQHLLAYTNGENTDVSRSMVDVDQMLGDLQSLQGSLETLLDAQLQANQATN